MNTRPTAAISRYDFWGLIFGGAYFRNFTVFLRAGPPLFLGCFPKVRTGRPDQLI